ncbi:MAG: iron complex outermembrane receptor protein [Chitinophagales bacterium]|jgi:iron complex outermembrane receptor protein
MQHKTTTTKNYKTVLIMKISTPALATLVLSSFITAQVNSQENADKMGFALEEVIVTANKRVQSLQEVPMSVSAFTEDFLRDSGLTNFADLQQYAPNLKISTTASTASTSVRIRGIGSVGTNSGIDPSVGMFIDGVYQGRAGMSVADLVDIERIEVLRGPQGTLYGKNTAAGAISIITRRPNDIFEGLLELTYANDNRIEARGMVNIPFGDTENAMRVSGYVVNGDHIYENEFNGEGLNDANKWGLRARTLLVASDTSEWLLTVDYSEEDTDCCGIAVIDYDGLSTLGTPTLNAASAAYQQGLIDANNGSSLPFNSFEDTEAISPPTADPFDDNYWVDGETTNKVTVGGVAVEWNKDLANNSSLTFINAWRNYSSDSFYDGDFTGHDAVSGSTEVELDQYSSEIRLASDSGNTVEYQVGLFGYYSEFDSLGKFAQSKLLIDKIGLGGLYSNGTLNTDDNLYTTTSGAAFGQLTWNMSEELSATFGLRYTYEKKERDGSQVTTPDPEGGIVAPNLPPIAGPNYFTVVDRSDTAVSPMINIRYFLTEDIMTYASISRGFKSGGFNQRREATLPDGTAPSGEFEEEIATNYEMGWKGSWLDRRLQVNGTFFYVEYDDFQSQGFDGSTVKVTNAGSMESYGSELEIVYLPAANLTLGSALGYTHATYSDFKNGECTVADNYDLTFYQNTNFLAPALAGEACTKDLTGEQLDNVPEWTVATFAQYKIELNENLNGTIRLEHSYTDSFFLDVDLDPNLENDAVNLFNLRLSLANENLDWEVAAWVRNITDEEYFAIGQDIPVLGGYIGVAAPERTYGATLRLFF